MKTLREFSHFNSNMINDLCHIIGIVDIFKSINHFLISEFDIPSLLFQLDVNVHRLYRISAQP